MYRTNTNLEESILRISECFFLRNSERDPVFNGVARRSTWFIPFPWWTLFSARSFHVFLVGSKGFANFISSRQCPCLLTLNE